MISQKQQERDFIVRLALVEKLGPVSRFKLWRLAHEAGVFDFEKLFEQYSVNSRITKIVKEQCQRIEFDLTFEYFRHSYPFITIIDDDYPPLLKETACPPILIYYYGSPSILKSKTLAVVGSRRMTKYGNKIINALLPPVVSVGVTIVSGLARGVDSTAQRVALECGGKVVGVIGCGLTQSYPKENRDLQDEIMRAGLLLSEYPIGTPPYPHHFPERNRIIAGVCHTCLVVESAQKSGTLITANIALRENRNVCAVPGPIDVSSSVGCNELIEIGARPILKPSDLLDELDT